MSNIHKRGQRLHNRRTRSTNGSGVPVLYTRGAVTKPLVVTPSVEDLDATLEPTPTAKSVDKERDYLIVFADLTDAGFGEPQPGDRVTEVMNGVPTTFELMNRSTEPAWRWSDAQRTRVRLHTRHKVLS